MVSETPHLPPEDVVAKLNDRAVLRNYCEFAAIYRPTIAAILFGTLDSSPGKRRAIGLEIAALYVATLEDLVLWFFVLRKWQPGEELLFDVLDSTVVSEGRRSDISSRNALAELASWTPEQLRTEFRLPNDAWLLEHGWDAGALESHKAGLSDLLRFVRAALEQRTNDEGVLVTAYNKIKHGALAIAATENSELGVSVMLASRRGPMDESSGKPKINVGWIPCDDADLQKLTKSVFVTSHVMWTIFNLIYMFRFDPTWSLPVWPFPRDL